MVGSHFDPEKAAGWPDAWEAAFSSQPQDGRPAQFHPVRLKYYLDALKELLFSEQPNRCLWPLLHTWSEMAVRCPAGTPQRAAWEQVVDGLGLFGPGLVERLAALDAFLDTVDETLENWAQQNGV